MGSQYTNVYSRELRRNILIYLDLIIIKSINNERVYSNYTGTKKNKLNALTSVIGPRA
jgi:hypothetical protein